MSSSNNHHSPFPDEADPLALHEDVLPQIEALTLDPGKPLIVTDCDEVLVRFVSGFETYLEGQNLWLDLSGFRLSGHIKRRDTNEALPMSDMPDLFEDFFSTYTDRLMPAPGAVETLAALSERAQIVVLTNIPIPHKETRIRSLKSHGMDYPVVANLGLKGGAVRNLAERVDTPVIFLDDLPHNIASVAKAHEPAHLIHFIADTRLADLLGRAEDCHFHTTEWTDAHEFMSGILDRHGF